MSLFERNGFLRDILYEPGYSFYLSLNQLEDTQVIKSRNKNLTQEELSARGGRTNQEYALIPVAPHAV